MPELAYVQGRYLPIEQAVVPIDDRGYQFGDGVYEVLYIFGGKPFLYEEHLERFRNSLDGLEIRGIGLDRIRQVAEGLIEKSGLTRAKLYISISRGVAPRNHPYPENAEPMVVATIRPIPAADPEMLERGLRMVTMEDIRWGRCDLKTLNLLPNVMAKQEAMRRGVDDAILVSSEGIVREATSANVFCVVDGDVYTHPLTHNILPGITRGLLIRLAEQAGIRVLEEFYTVEFLKSANEIFLTGTIAELIAVTELDGTPVADGKPGPITRRLRADYDDYLAALTRG